MGLVGSFLLAASCGPFIYVCLKAYTLLTDEPHAQAVYAFEQAEIDPRVPFRRLSEEEARAVIEQVAQDLGMKRVPELNYQRSLGRSETSGAIISGGYNAFSNTIDVAAEYAFLPDLLHELAHAAQGGGLAAGHRAGFVDYLLPLYSRYLGLDLKDLARRARAHGLEFHPRKMAQIAAKMERGGPAEALDFVYAAA
jgi:hypothetical protein